MPKHSLRGEGKPDFLEFREDLFSYVAMLTMAFLLVMIWLAHWFGESESSRYSGLLPAWSMTVAGLLIIAVVVLLMKRVRIEGEDVRISHPWLGAAWQRSFRGGDLASAEMARPGQGYYVVMRLHDGRVIRYFTCDEKKAKELLAALKSAMETAKPSPVADDELA